MAFSFPRTAEEPNPPYHVPPLPAPSAEAPRPHRPTLRGGASTRRGSTGPTAPGRGEEDPLADSHHRRLGAPEPFPAEPSPAWDEVALSEGRDGIYEEWPIQVQDRASKGEDLLDLLDVFLHVFLGITV